MSFGKRAIAGIAASAIALAGLSFALGLHWASLKEARLPREALDVSVLCEANRLSSNVMTASLLDGGHVGNARDILLIDIRAGARKLDAFSSSTRGQTRNIAERTLREADAYLSKGQLTGSNKGGGT